MNRPRASRLSNGTPARGHGLIEKYLPLGSLQRKLAIYVIIPLFILLFGLLVTDRLIMPGITRHGSEFPLPDFRGEALAEVQHSLGDLGLRYEISGKEFSPGKEAGVVLNQFPLADTKVKSGRSIKFVVSLGKKMVAIPDVAGKSVRQAMLDLESAGLSLGEIAWAFSDTIPERVVVFSYPAASTEIPLGASVNLMVNKGRASDFTYMPKVVGLPLSEAQRLIEEKLLKVGIVSYRTDDKFLPETVLEQAEPQGTELDVGTEIDLVVSST